MHIYKAGRFFLSNLLLISAFAGSAQNDSRSLVFHSRKGLIISVKDDTIAVIPNGTQIYTAV